LKLLTCAAVVSLSIGLSGCVKEQDYGKLLSAGVSVLQASSLKESDVKKTARLSAQQMDKKNRIAPASSAYSKRLVRITKNLQHFDGMVLNYKVYLNKELNAFAMPDGTVRVYSGLLDALKDDQVLAVVGHEIGHVKLKHSYHQMKKQMLTGAAFQAASATTGTVGDLTSSQLGSLAYKAINAKFSQTDELQADQYSLAFLKSQGKQPSAMLDVIYTFQKKMGNGAGFLSSHPSNSQRIDAIKKAL